MSRRDYTALIFIAVALPVVVRAYNVRAESRKVEAWRKDRHGAIDQVRKRLNALSEDESITQEEFDQVFDEEMAFLNLICDPDAI